MAAHCSNQKGNYQTGNNPEELLRSPVVTRSRSKTLASKIASSTQDIFQTSSSAFTNLKRKHPKSLEGKSYEKKSKLKVTESHSKQKSKGKTKMSNPLLVPDIDSDDDSFEEHAAAEILFAAHNDANSVRNITIPQPAHETGSFNVSATINSDNSETLPCATMCSDPRSSIAMMMESSLINVPHRSTYVSYAQFAQAEAASHQYASFQNNDPHIMIDGIAQNFDLLNNELACGKKVDKNCKRLSSGLQSAKKINSEEIGECSSHSKASSSKSERKVSIKVPKLDRGKSSGSCSSASNVTIKNDLSCETQFSGGASFSEINPGSSSIHHFDSKKKSDSDLVNSSKLMKLVKMNKVGEQYKNRHRQPHAEKAAAESLPEQMETSCSSVSKKENAASNTIDFMSNLRVPVISEMSFLNSDSGASSSSNPSETLTASSSRENLSSESELGRLQALLEARGIPLHIFGSLGHRVQHLFHRSMGNSSNSRAQQLLQGLQATGDEGRQLQAVIEMCQLLVMGNEDTLIGFPVKQVVPVLITLLSMEHNFEMMNNACRALTYLMEALPRSSSVVVEAVPIFLNKLQFIQCMDVAEQSLTALEMLSKWHSKAILHAKGISVCLMYLDFFSINAQRTALAITANCCQNLLPDEFNLVQESLSFLSGWLRHQDEKSVESICLAFSRLVDCFQEDAKCLKEIASQNLLTNIQQLLVVSPTIISTQTFTLIIRMLALMCASCSELAVLLLKQNISNTVCYLLTGTSDYSHDIELTSRTPQELYEISYLMCELMPPLPNDGIFAIDSLFMKQKNRYKDLVVWKWRDDAGTWHFYSLADCRVIEAAYQAGKVTVTLAGSDEETVFTIDFNTMEQVNRVSNAKRPVLRHLSNTVETSVSSTDASSSLNAKIDCFKNNAELVNSCIKSLFPVLYEVYCSTAGPSVRYNCLRSMLRMLHFAPPDILTQVLKNQMISRHIAAQLASPDYKVVISTLQMAEMLMQKLPHVFGVFFIREGVLHEIRLLSEKDIHTKQQAILMGSHSGHNPTMYQAVPDFLSNATASFSEARRLPSFFSPYSESSSASASLRSDEKHSCVSVKMTEFLKKKCMTASTSSSLPKEMCTSPSATSSHRSDTYEKINAWIKLQTQRFECKYFSVEQLDASHPAVNILNQLSAAVAQLESPDGALQALMSIQTLITESDISTFELIHSGLIKKLRLFLTSLDKDSGSKELESRLRSFLHIFIGSPLLKQDSVPDKLNSAPLSLFITKLNACISHLEQFAVKVHDHPSYGCVSRRGASSYKLLNAHQLKCTFQRHPECSNLRQWRGGPVMVDPLASVQNIDRYLVSQGYGILKDSDDDDEEEDDESDPSDEENSEEDIEELASAIRIDQEPISHKLQFLIGDHVLPYNMTVYQALRQYGARENQNSEAQGLDTEDPLLLGNIWDKTHIISYRPVHPEADSSTEVKLPTPVKTDRRKRTISDHSTQSKGSASNSKSKGNWEAMWNDGVVPESTSPLAFISNLPESNQVQDPSLEVIYLLRVIHALNCHWGSLYLMNSWEPAVAQTDFINVKLTLKANRQLQDVLAVMTGNVPTWLSQITRDFPFLFPFQTRYLLFYVISFDRERALQRLLDVFPEMRNSERIVTKLDRKKRTVSRDSILKQAEAVLQDVGNSKALLEIQYKNEVGTGLGPTLEFYALVSKELQRAELEMWRGEKTVIKNGKGQHVNYVYNPAGLFPNPVSRNIKSSSLTKICNKFRLLGNVLAKAIMDSRLLDIPLSLAFYKWMLSQESNLALSDLKYIDESFAQTILKLEQVLIQKKRLENNRSLSAADLKSALESLSLDGCSLEDLSLDFTLPGYSHIEMKKSGKDTVVSIHNLEEYLCLLKHWIMKEGIWRQMKAFQEGFETVFPLSNLQIFYPEEMELLFCGSRHMPWSVKSLKECCRADHGYTFASPAIKFFFDILSSYDQQQQRKFLQFVTGSPRLPVGGLKALSPPLTIVRKASDGDFNPDSYLPSVMTCVNYLKLPEYSSLEVMREKLEIAITEGQHSFHLS